MNAATTLTEAQDEEILRAEDVQAFFVETARGWKFTAMVERTDGAALLTRYAARDLPAFLTDRWGEVIGHTGHHCTAALMGEQIEMSA